MDLPTTSSGRRLRLATARVLIIACLIALSGGGGVATALAAGGDSSAIAINNRDGSSVFRLTFKITQVPGTSVTNQNAAIAYASCTDCQTVAISIQVLLISGSPTVFTPTNLAIAINENCDFCDTLAAAYQFAVGVDTELKFTADGRQQIADIRHQLEQLRNSTLTGPQIDAQVKILMTQLADVLNTQLLAVTQPAGSRTLDSSAPAPFTATPTTPDDPSTPSPSPTTTSTTPTDTTSTPTTSTDTTSPPLTDPTTAPSNTDSTTSPTAPDASSAATTASTTPTDTSAAPSTTTTP